MAQPIAPDYGQRFLLPPALEDWVPADHPARFLREFVDQQNLSAVGFTVPAATEGRPPYHPSLLLKIWLYGYFHRIRSTRKLETACREHLSLLWLTGMIQPDHNTLWRFWRDHQKALRQLFKQTVQLAVRSGATGLVVQALDGTKIEAAASGYSGWSKKYMEELLAQLDATLDGIELEVVAEHAAADQNSGYRLPAGLAEQKALREEIKKGLAQIQADDRKHYHPVEPEARRMKVGSTTRYAYNAQAVADAKEGIVVACEVTRQENDEGQLAPMIAQAQENVGLAALATTTLADSGYGTGADVLAVSEKGIRVLTPPAGSASSKEKPYAAQQFHYDAANQSVTCPQGKRLDHAGYHLRQGVRVERYRCHCHDCPVRAQCTRNRGGREIEVWPHTAEVQRMRETLDQRGPADLYAQRKWIIEPRFAQIKHHDGFRRWTAWGLDGVKTQWAMICTTLNLRVLYRRWQNKRGVAAAAVLASAGRQILMETGVVIAQTSGFPMKMPRGGPPWSLLTCNARPGGS
jgi:transposase